MIIGFASGIEAEERASVTPRTLCFGQFSLGGVLLSYSSDPLAARRVSGFNITPRSVGDRIQARLVGLLDAGRIHPVIGKTVAFADLPLALEEMEDRRTIGRIVVDVAPS
jgi:NADPH:quinone reductase-like Zn-dependent oxidoreductase